MLQKMSKKFPQNFLPGVVPQKCKIKRSTSLLDSALRFLVQFASRLDFPKDCYGKFTNFRIPHPESPTTTNGADSSSSRYRSNFEKYSAFVMYTLQRASNNFVKFHPTEKILPEYDSCEKFSCWIGSLFFPFGKSESIAFSKSRFIISASSIEFL
jgi:hypothetical protein